MSRWLNVSVNSLIFPAVEPVIVANAAATAASRSCRKCLMYVGCCDRTTRDFFFLHQRFEFEM